jgi:hypothetical protein
MSLMGHQMIVVMSQLQAVGRFIRKAKAVMECPYTLYEEISNCDMAELVQSDEIPYVESLESNQAEIIY